MIWKFTSFGFMCSFFVVSCQDYRFEELPTSVIHQKRQTTSIEVATAADVLFVMDNSGSMVGEQRAVGESFKAFSSILDERFGPGMYRIAVITTGIESQGCQPCTDTRIKSCTNESGETGRFQSRLGWNVGTVDDPEYRFEDDPTCKIITSDNVDRCFYQNDKGVVLVGVNGCGYEKGLEAMRLALSEPLVSGWNDNFLRPEASLAIVVVSDEDDCGKVGETTEDLQGILGRTCYYAAKGEGPTGLTSDSEGKPYALTPVSEYYDFLVGLKGDSSKVRFAAIVGVDDPSRPALTEIRYENHTEENANIYAACSTSGCQGQYCNALPGTRYLKLAEMFGIGTNAFVDTICKSGFSETMAKLGSFVTCPSEFNLKEPILDPGLANILINDVAVPLYSCDNANRLEECQGLGDNRCSNGKQCIRTWDYSPPADPAVSGGKITFASHYDPCVLITSGTIRIDLVYATD